MPCVAFISLGCPKNTVDTEVMLYELQKQYSITQHFEEADVLVVNTCGFIEDAKAESIDAILSLAKIKESDPSKLLIVTGCLAQRYAKELLDDIPEINVCMGVEQYLNVLKIIERAKGGERFIATERSPLPLIGKRLLITPKHTVYVKISEGCNNACAFCAIPKIRGRYRSNAMESIVGEVADLVAQGAKEVILVAEDTTRYGEDLYGKPCLGELLEKLAILPNLKRLRVLYCYPDTLTKELIDTMAKYPNIAKYLDIPLQHADESLLLSMNRKGTPKSFSDTISYAKAKEFIIRTTFIVGFPGETEEQFQNLVNYVKKMQFDRLGVFTYSPEEGTKGAKMPNQIDDDVKQSRKDAIMTLQANISLQNNQKRVGEVCEVLVEKVSREGIEARSYGESPDIDGLIFLPYDPSKKVGEMHKAKIVAADVYDLQAKWC